jgi:beta-glucosidase
LLTDLLQSWGIEHPLTTSDCGAVSNIFSKHHFASTLTEAAVMAIKAGVDTLCDNAPLEEALADGLVSVETLQHATATRLHKEILAGVFNGAEQAYMDLDVPAGEPCCVLKEHTGLALRAATEAMTLLQNKRGSLPLSSAELQGQILMSGPMANTTKLHGGYSGFPIHTVTLLEGFTEAAGGNVTYIQGCNSVKCTSDAGFGAAVKVAKGKVAILAMVRLVCRPRNAVVIVAQHSLQALRLATSALVYAQYASGD